jgi:hypothetical protein
MPDQNPKHLAHGGGNAAAAIAFQANVAASLTD